MRPLLLAGALLALGLASDALARAIQTRSARPPGSLPELGRAVSKERAQSIRLAALRVEVPSTGESFLYVRQRGRWRSATAFGAPCVPEAVPSLAEHLIEATGAVRTRRSEPHPSYGLDAPRYRIELSGPAALERADRDVELRFEIGASVPVAGGGTATFARLDRDPAVWELDLDLSELERPPGSNVPPMLDQRVVPGPWPGQPEAAFREIAVEGSAGSFRLVRRDVPLDQRQPGAPSWRWWLVRGGTEEATSFQRVETYAAYLRLVQWAGLEDPARAGELGFETPSVRIAATPLEDGRPAVEIRLAGRAERVRGVWCLNAADRVLCAVDDETARGLDARPEQLTDESTREVWSLIVGHAFQRH